MHGECDVWYFDASGFCLTPSIPYAWQPIGSVIEVPTSAHNKRINVLGFLTRHNDLFPYIIEGRVDTDVVIEFLRDVRDMAANTVGHPQTDHLRTMGLVEAGAAFAFDVLRPGGAFVAKVLAGGADSELVSALKRNSTTVKHAKPPASRKESSEWYVVAQGFKGRDKNAAPAEAGAAE